MKKISLINQLGKRRSLRTLSKNGKIFIAAVDHRNSLMKMMNKELSFSEMRYVKKKIVDCLSREASALLLDPNYGIDLDGGNGLIVSLESTGFSVNKSGERVTKFLDFWEVSKIKKIGAAGVKLVLYINPLDKQNRKEAISIARKVGKLCKKYDIVFLLEPIVPKGIENRGLNIIQSVKLLDDMGADVLKLEYPGSEHVEELGRNCNVPWVLLSGGIDYENFKEALKISCKFGCSGFVAGRSLWKELPENYSKNNSLSLDSYLRGTVASRFIELKNIVEERGANLWDSIGEYEIEDISWFEHYKGI